MKSTFNLPVFAVFLLLITSGCNNPHIEDNDTAALKWLTGNRADSALGFYEGWKTSGDTMFSGYGFQIADKDTVFKESLSIRKTGKTWNYIVRHGNEETIFTLVNTVGDSLVFDNPVNEYPKRITYLNQPDGNIVVTIENPGDRGKITRFNFIPLK
ncbi:MAG: hypothetical protein AB9834_07830 [Lentimicrobium sp.]